TSAGSRRLRDAVGFPAHPRALAVRSLSGMLVLVEFVMGWLVLINGTERIGHPFPGFLTLANRVVVSAGSPSWLLSRESPIRFAQVTAIEGTPIADAERIQELVRRLRPGTTVTYRLRSQGAVLRHSLAIRLFTFRDYIEVYVVFFLAGLCFALAGMWTM